MDIFNQFSFEDALDEKLCSIQDSSFHTLWTLMQVAVMHKRDSWFMLVLYVVRPLLFI